MMKAQVLPIFVSAETQRRVVREYSLDRGSNGTDHHNSLIISSISKLYGIGL